MFNVGFWMGSEAEGAKGAEGKAGHRLKKMEEDVFAGCGSQPAKVGVTGLLAGPMRQFCRRSNSSVPSTGRKAP